VDEKYRKKYEGRYDEGYEKLKEERIESLKKAGMIPNDSGGCYFTHFPSTSESLGFSCSRRTKKGSPENGTLRRDGGQLG